MSPDRTASTWLLRLPSDVQPVHAVRGTLLAASRAQLRAAGLFDAYADHLSKSVRQELDAFVAASWLPMELAHAHFSAIGALDLDPATIAASTAPVAERLHRVFVSTAFQLLKAGGLTPWAILPTAVKVWDRLFLGGAIGVQQIGPKDGRVVIAGSSLVRHTYHRIGLRMHVQFVVGLASERAHVREVSCDPDLGTLTLLCRWV